MLAAMRKMSTILGMEKRPSTTKREPCCEASVPILSTRCSAIMRPSWRQRWGTVSDTVTLFVDTNAFIQVQDLHTRPWRTLFAGVKRVDIMVASSVVRELDKHKTSQRQRLRDRSRAAWQLIRRALKEPDRMIIVRPAAPEVRLVLAKVKPDWSSLTELDPNNPDDFLVAEAVTYGSGAILFSHDGGPQFSADKVGLQAIEPPQDWLLPDEPTDKDKELAKVKAELILERQRKPTIIVEFDKSHFGFKTPQLKPLTASERERCVEKFLAQYPRPKRPAPNVPSVNRWKDVEHNEWDAYLGRRTRFEADVIKYFETLHTKVQGHARCAHLTFVIENDSGVSTEGLRIEANVEGEGWLIASLSDTIPGSIDPPKAPRLKEIKRPFGVDVAQIAMASAMSAIPDPVEFRWGNRPGVGSTQAIIHCQEFRARRKVDNELLVYLWRKLPQEGTVTLNISASNLSNPLSRLAAFSMEEVPATWADEWVWQWLPEKVKACFPA